MYRRAVFNESRTHRYWLYIRWNYTNPVLNMIMLNPSTADEVQNDPTVERQVRRAYQQGYGALIVTNIFGLRSTDPSALYTAEDPIGSENDWNIRDAARAADVVVCAWGNHGSLNGRGDAVQQMLCRMGIRPFSLGTTQSGHPRHPLYIGYGVSFVPDYSSHQDARPYELVGTRHPLSLHGIGNTEEKCPACDRRAVNAD